jgi:TonB family protein
VIISWMLDAIVFTLFLGVAAMAAERVVRDLGRQGRWPWVGALVTATLWPFLMPFVSRLPSGSLLGGRTSIALLPAIRVIPDAGGLVPLISANHAAVVTSVVVLAWMLGSCVLGLRLALALRTLNRVRDVAERRLVDGTPVLLDDRVGPAVIGIRDLTVIVPRSILELDTPMRALVLRHEREHRDARDPWLLFAASVAVMVVPWNLALLWICRRLHLALELDCDARVLAAGAQPTPYGKLLFWTAQRAPLHPPLAPTLATPRSHLERRIIAMHTRLKRPRPARILLSAALFVAAGIGACSAGTSDAPTREATKLPNVQPVVANDQPYFEFQVEKQVQQIPGTRTLRYPDSLRAANVEGDVLAQFVVDEAGQYEPNTFKVLKSSHELFTAAVKSALPNMKFYPAEVGGRKVKQLVQQPFTFSLQRNQRVR